MKRVVALVPNVLEVSPGQRLRIEAWTPYLEQHGWKVDFFCFEDEVLHDVVYQRGHLAAKTMGMIRCWFAQWRRILRRGGADVIFVFREAALIGPALLERLAVRDGTPMIYDVDDPIFVPARSPTSGWFSMLKFPGKSHRLFRMSSTTIAVNESLAEYARQFAADVVVVPNAVDRARYPMRPPATEGDCVLGWIGSHSTVGNLNLIAGALRDLAASRGAVLRVIGAEAPVLPGVGIDFRPWSAETEVADLLTCDVGLSPVPPGAESTYKTFYKTQQYMAVGLPVVASPRGSNRDLIEHGVTGFLAETNEEWIAAIERLLADAKLREAMGRAARERIFARVSAEDVLPQIAAVFEAAAAKRAPRWARQVLESGHDDPMHGRVHGR
jgi:glycosyltransferase involved in cell wall biosynthesis